MLFFCFAIFSGNALAFFILNACTCPRVLKYEHCKELRSKLWIFLLFVLFISFHISILSIPLGTSFLFASPEIINLNFSGQRLSATTKQKIIFHRRRNYTYPIELRKKELNLDDRLLTSLTRLIFHFLTQYSRVIRDWEIFRDHSTNCSSFISSLLRNLTLYKSMTNQTVREYTYLTDFLSMVEI